MKKKECKATLSRYTKIIKRKVFLFSLKNSNRDQFCSDGTTQLGDCEWFAHPSLFYFFQRLSDVPIRHTFLICVWWYPKFINSLIFWHDFNFGYTTWQTSAFCSEMKACKNCLSSIIALLTSWFKLSRNWLKLITSYTYLSLKWQLFLVVVEKRRKKPQRYFKLIERNASSRTRSRHTWLSFLPFFSNYVIAPDF